MRVFELYFNPKNKDETYLETFVYTPTNIYEKRLGNLYMVGELAQAMPQNAALLKNLFSIIKREYYGASLKKSSEASLQEALKKGNESLERESRKGNVSWLGNLNLTILTFKDPTLIFTKVGDVKILLIRDKELAEISGNLDNALSPPNPLKVFGNMATGKLDQGDRVVVLNKSVFIAFSKTKGLLNQISRAANEKELKQILKINQTGLAEVAGACLFLTVGGPGESKQTITLHRELPKFSFSQFFLKPIDQFSRKMKQHAQFKLPSLKAPQIKMPQVKIPRVKLLPSFRLPHIKFAVAKKQIILVISLALILASFFLLFGGEKGEELKNVQQKLAEAQAKTTMAENFLILKDEEKAKTLFQEALAIVSPLTKRGSPLREEALFLQNSIEEHLK